MVATSPERLNSRQVVFRASRISEGLVELAEDRPDASPLGPLGIRGAVQVDVSPADTLRWLWDEAGSSIRWIASVRSNPAGLFTASAWAEGLLRDRHPPLSVVLQWASPQVLQARRLVWPPIAATTQNDATETDPLMLFDLGPSAPNQPPADHSGARLTLSIGLATVEALVGLAWQNHHPDDDPPPDDMT